MEPRNIRRDKTGCLFVALLGMAFADGCGPASEEGSGRRANAKTAQVASVSPEEGQAFLVGALVTASAEGEVLRNALQQAGQTNHLELDAQPLDTDTKAQTALLGRWQSRHAEGLLICASKPAAAQAALNEAVKRRIPVVLLEWEEAKPSPSPAAPASGVAVPSHPARAQTISNPAQSAPAKRAVLLTLFHNGKSTRQRLSADTPQEWGASAVATLSAYLRGEKVKPTKKTAPPTL